MGLISLDFQYRYRICDRYCFDVVIHELLYGDNNNEQRAETDSKHTGLAMIAGIICCTVIHLNECTPVQHALI